MVNTADRPVRVGDGESPVIAHSALLSIDLQNEYRGVGAYPVKGYDRILANAAALLAAARAADVPVIHVQGWVEQSERPQYPLLGASVTEESRSAVAGSFGADICTEVAPLRGEILIRKRWPSAFKDTPLRQQLLRLEVQHIIAVGVWTDSCVRGTVLDAIYNSYRVWLVKDACGSGTDTMHRAGVLDIANRLYGGGVFRAAEALKALAGEPYGVWRCSRPIEFPYTLATLESLYDAL
jgi:maleamate amidohydrolase